MIEKAEKMTNREEELVRYAIGFVTNQLDDGYWTLVDNERHERVSPASLENLIVRLADEFIHDSQLPTIFDELDEMPVG
jgi:hypothetical protein